MLEILQGELERLFDREQLEELSRRCLGLDPGELSDIGTRGTFARSLVERAARTSSVAALADAVVALRPAAGARLHPLRLSLRDPPDDVVPGDAIGLHVVESRLGEGPWSTVVRARKRDAVLRLRLLRPLAVSDPGAVERYFVATRLAATVEHEGLPRSVHVGDLGGRKGVAHPFVDGAPLAKLVSTPRSLGEAWPLLRAVLSPLSALHRHGLPHGALHPSNILVSGPMDAPLVMLLDAGAHHLRGERLMGRVAGGQVDAVTALFASPEALMGEVPTARSDVYALGQLITFLSSGRLPNALGPDAVRRLLSAAPELPSFVAPRGSVAPELDELVLAMLDADPSKRPADAVAVTDALEGIIGRKPPGTFAAQDLDGLIERLMARPDDPEIAAVLEASVERGADARRVAEALVLAAEQVKDDEAGRAAGQRLLARAGSLYETAVGDAEAAEHTYELLSRVAPHAEVAWAALERVCRRLGAWDRLAELHLAQAERAGSSLERARAYAKLGGVLRAGLGDETQALLAFVQALTEEPGEATTAVAIEELCGTNPSRWQEVLDACAHAATAMPPSEHRNGLLARMGSWYLDRLRKNDLAAFCHEEILRTDPGNDAALSALAALYRDASKWRELADVLTRKAAGAVPGEVSRDLRVEAASVLLERARDAEGATRLYEQVLREDPTHAEARRALLGIYRRSGALADAERMLVTVADSTNGPERHRALTELARLRAEAEGNLSGAIEILERVLSENPADLEALHAAGMAYAASGRHDATLRVLRQESQIAVTPRAKIEALERLANLERTEFLDREGAAHALEQILGLDPTHGPAEEGLITLYEELEQWPALARVLERSAEHARDVAARAAKLSKLAAVLQDRVLDRGRAMAVWEEVLRCSPSDRRALDALAALRADAGDSGKAVEALDALAESDAAPERRAEHLCRAGELLSERGDPDAAAEHYRKALATAPGFARAALLLSARFVAGGEARAAADVLERALLATVVPSSRAALAAALAGVFADHVGDPGRARAAAERAIALEPGNSLAHRVLGDLDRSAGKGEEALRHYDVVDLSRQSVTERVPVLRARGELLSRAGRAAEARAIVAELERAGVDLAAAAVAASAVAFEAEEPIRALEVARDALSRYERVLPAEELASLLHREGESLRRLGRWEEAIACLERAARTDPRSTLPLRSLASAFRDAGRPRDRVGVLEALLERVSGGARTDLLVELGELAVTLDDPEQATRRWTEALADAPQDRRVLLKLLALDSGGRDWERVIGDVLKLAEIEPEPGRRARYLLAAARIAEREQADHRKAAEFLDRALSCDPLSEDVLSLALEVRSKQGDADGIRLLLEQTIRKAAEVSDRGRALRLAKRLAELHLMELHADDAIAVGEAVLALGGDDAETEGWLAELYATDPVRYLDRAVALERRILSRDPYRSESHDRLFRLYDATRHHDAAWCCSQALVLLHRATREEEEVFKRHRRGAPIPGGALITQDDWERLIVHPDVDPALSKIFAMIHPIVAASRGRSLAELGLSPDDALDPGACSGTLVRAIEHVAGVLRMPVPLLFEDAQSAQLVTMGRGQRRLLLLSSRGVRGDLPALETAFVAAAHLAYYRPAFYARTVLPLPGLKAWLLAAIRLVAPRLPVGAELEGLVEEASRILGERLGGAERERIAGPVEELLRHGNTADLGRWMRGTDLTSDRLGFVFSDDLRTAVGVLRATPDTAGSLPVSERVRSLLAYAVSSEYLTLRDHLRVSTEWRDGGGSSMAELPAKVA